MKPLEKITTGSDSKKRNPIKKVHYMKFFPVWANKIYADLKLNTDKIRGYKKIKSFFRSKMGYDLNLESPRSYNEKIIWKKIHDQNPLLTVTADKYMVRSYVKETLGKELANRILIPLYHVTDNPEDIPFERLPERFVVKPNHGSRMHIFVKGNKEELREEIISKCKEWLKVNYGLYNYEWAYRNIKRMVIIEELLQTENNKLPRDYKFYCFHGKCQVIRVSENRFGDRGLAGYFHPDWSTLPVYNPGYDIMEKPFDKPSNLKQLIKLSEKLSVNFDAVRVDLYSFDDKIYFGELTHYDASGMARFEPESFDYEMGSYWKTEKKYWEKSKNIS